MSDCRLAVLLLLLCVRGTACFFFQTTQEPQYPCLPGVTLGQLSNITVTMADMSRFYTHLLPRILIPRIPNTPGHAQVRQFIESEMRALGWAVDLDIFDAPTPYGTKTFTNIIATLKPAATKRIVFACHYDSKYLAGSPNFVAATDSAVPCAILMDTAWKLRDMVDIQLQDVTPQFIFFDGEEAFVRWTATDSLYGSRHLAWKWQNEPDPNDELAANNLENIDLFVLLDLIGGPNLKFTDFYYNTTNYFRSLYHIEYCLENSRIIPPRHYYQRPMFDLWAQYGSIEDDHIPFIQKGVRILHLISTPFPRVWHRPEDNLQSLDTPTIARFTTTFRLFFYSLFRGAYNF